MIDKLKKTFSLNAKNLVGWSTRRKILVISVDDYGNVRIDSRKARENMQREGIDLSNRFDTFDTLETRRDLEALYEVLTTVKDGNGRYPVFTTFAMPCNINFEKMAETGFEQYYYELLPETFRKLSQQQPGAYRGAWNLLEEGIEKGLIVPLFHGREHLNLKVFNEMLSARNNALLTALHNRSYPALDYSGYKTIAPMAAFDFWEFEENQQFEQVINSGLDAFERVYGFSPDHFNPPGGREHPVLHKILNQRGIRFIDTPMIKREHQGRGRFKTVFNYTGKTNIHGQIYLVRNVVFEPTEDRGIDWVDYALTQIEAAFRWNHPAIVSSHRVNFCGHIDEQNRRKGLESLEHLLRAVTERWPEVEFMAANELGGEIAQNNHE
ncbi:MAG: hypothetical protein R3281_13775 [Balneolaceae bacterium]|nr:hypothetical protein [Balneolaceae bacterium]